MGPEQERVKVNELLNALEADLRLRGKESPQVRSQMKRIRGYFGEWRAVGVTADAVDRYIEKLREAGLADATINRERNYSRKHSNWPSSASAFPPRPRFATCPKRAMSGRVSSGMWNLMRLWIFCPSTFGILPIWLSDRLAQRRDRIAALGRPGRPCDPAERGERQERLGPPNCSDSSTRRTDRPPQSSKTGRAGRCGHALPVHLPPGRQPVREFRESWATACVAARLGQFYCKKCNQAPVGAHRCEACNAEIHPLLRSPVSRPA